MPAVTASVTLRIPADVLERVDVARGDMSRNLWMVTALRMVVDSGVGGGAWFSKGAVEQALEPLRAAERGFDPPAPAEQPSQRSNSPADFSIPNAVMRAASTRRHAPNCKCPVCS